MRKIIEHRKLLGVDKAVTLSELKSVYRNFMKEFHPEKIQDNEELKLEVEEKSKRIIEAYHFLVSIAPETQAFNLDNYTNTTNNSGIEDYSYKGQTLKITFQDGSVYEYFGIPKNIYNKFLNSSTLLRFARRHIFYSFTYRNVSKQTA